MVVRSAMSSYSEAMREFKDRLTSMRLSLQDMVEVLLRGEELFAQLNISRYVQDLL